MHEPPDPPDETDETGDGSGEPVEVELTDELDLHSFHPREVAGLVRDYIDHAAAQGWERVRIVHGKGIGAIRQAVHRELAKHPEVERFGLSTDRASWGATVVTLRAPAIVLRRLSPEDDLQALTDLLHRAYAPLLEQGMRFVASWQDVEQTRKRCAAGEAWILETRGRVVGTVTLYPGGGKQGSPWLDRPDVACFGQYAVDPAWQGRGLGRRLLELVERRAREAGHRHLALDTSERASELIATYERHGFRFVEHVQWGATNYRSVVMSKEIAGGP